MAYRCLSWTIWQDSIVHAQCVQDEIPVRRQSGERFPGLPHRVSRVTCREYTAGLPHVLADGLFVSECTYVPCLRCGFCFARNSRICSVKLRVSFQLESETLCPRMNTPAKLAGI